MEEVSHILKINSAFYAAALKEALPNGGVVFADNHRVHVSKYTTGKLRRAGVSMIRLPTASPYLSPMDFAAWHDVGERMRATQKRMHQTSRESERACQTRLEKMAKSIPPTTFAKICGNLAHRLNTCHRTGGGVVGR